MIEPSNSHSVGTRLAASAGRLLAAHHAHRRDKGAAPPADVPPFDPGAWALLDGRNHVLPDDVQAVLLPVAGHRLKPARGAATNHRARAELVAELQKAVAIP